MWRKHNEHQNYSLFVLAALAVGIGVPTDAYAAVVEFWNPTPLNLSGCTCPTAWILVTSNNPNIGSGHQYLDYSVSWLEGYDDIDRRVRAPNNVTTYTSSASDPQTSEEGRVSSPPSGGWDEYYKTWSISSTDASGATQGTFVTTAYNHP